MLTCDILYDRLIKSGLATEDSIIGCTELELGQIIKCSKRVLPSDYLDFMRRFGRKAGRFLSDIDMFYPSVLTLRSTAVEILMNGSDRLLTLPDDAFVFSVRYGEQFMCFSGTTDDAVILSYMFGDESFGNVGNSLRGFLLRELEYAEWGYKQIKGTPYDLGDG